MFLPKNHPSVLRLPKHFVFALATLTGGCYSTCYRGRYYSVTSKIILSTCYFAVTGSVTFPLLGNFMRKSAHMVLQHQQLHQLLVFLIEQIL